VTAEFHGDPPLYLTSSLLRQGGLPHLFSTRHLGGVRPWRDPAGPFDASVADFLDGRGMGRGPAAFLRQVHGADVVIAERGGLVGEADVLVTEREGLPLAIFTADCLPIVLYDPDRRRLAMAHAGWRGTVDRASRVATLALTHGGSVPGRLLVAIGPSIGPCCYEVDSPVIDRLSAAFPDEWPNWVTAVGPGKWMLDLWKANEDQLKAHGVPPEHIDNPRLCTACHSDLFFSYRKGGYGRLVAVAAIPGRPAEAC